MTPTREILWNVTDPQVVALYVLMGIPIAFLAFGVARRARMWLRGQSDELTHRRVGRSD